MKPTIALSVLLAGGLFCAPQVFGADSWTETLVCPDEAFTNVGRNAYFVLEPGYQTVLAGKEGGKLAEVTTTVLGETQDIGGVRTRVVEERETSDGKLVEVSRSSTNETVKTPVGVFKHCLKTRETTPLEAGTATKCYAPDIGLVEDGKLKLVKHGFVAR
jgi:hypothetical protein